MTSGAVSDSYLLCPGPSSVLVTLVRLRHCWEIAWLCQVCENVVKRLLGLEWDVSEEEVTS